MYMMEKNNIETGKVALKMGKCHLILLQQMPQISRTNMTDLDPKTTL